MVAGGGVTDTISAEPAQALVVEARDAGGRALAGVVVRFEAFAAGTPGTSRNMNVAALESPRFLAIIIDTTDGRGRAAVAVRLGERAGAGVVTVSIPEHALQTSAAYTVLPGAATSVTVAPVDTAVLVGGSYGLRPRVTDRRGNPRADVAQFAVLNGPVAVDAGGRVAGSAIGRARVVASVGQARDTASLSVMPTATLAAVYGAGFSGTEGGVVLFRTDGAEMRVLLPRPYATNGSRGLWPTWHPAGDRLAFVADRTLFTVDTLGRTTPLVREIPGVDATNAVYVGADGEYAPQYSADGRLVYFTAQTFRGVGEVWRVGADGSGLTQVIGQAGFSTEVMPSPHPDGERLAYQRGAANAWAIRVESLPTRATPLVPLVVPGTSPRWSPRGDVLAYLDARGRLRALRADGADGGVIAFGAGAQPGFNWSPDGAWLVTSTEQGLALVRVGTGEVLPLPLWGPGDTQLSQPSWRP